MNSAVDEKLYKHVKKQADAKFNEKTSAYKSMWIVKMYKAAGGKFKIRKKKEKGGLKKWVAEDWIQVLPYVTDGTKVKCGQGTHKKACRPSIRINESTPLTIDEVIKLHGKRKVKQIAKEKQKNSNLRISWKAVKKSKKSCRNTN